jgi:hypothetical protein
MADAGGDDAHQHLAVPWRFDIDFGDFQRLPGSPGNGSACFDHQRLSLVMGAAAG